MYIMRFVIVEPLGNVLESTFFVEPLENRLESTFFVWKPLLNGPSFHDF